MRQIHDLSANRISQYEMTPKDKVDALLKANPKLTVREACVLLGIKEIREPIEMPDFFKDLFSGK